MRKKLDVVSPRSVLLALGAITLVLFGACSEEIEAPTDCTAAPANPNLKSVFYWGVDTPSNWVPNTGSFIGGVAAPTWIDNATIIARSGALLNGLEVSGLFVITVDSLTSTYKSYTVMEYDEFILSLTFDAGTSKIIALESTGLSQRIVSGAFDAGPFSVDEEVVAGDWAPTAAALWPGHEGIVFAATPPDSKPPGVYWRRPDATAGYVDSLLVETFGAFIPPNGLAVTADGRRLLFAKQDGFLYLAQTTLMSYDLDGAQAATVVTDKQGSLNGIAANPSDSELAVLSYHFLGRGQQPTQDETLLLDLSQGAEFVLDLNTRAAVCGRSRTGPLVWDPSGTRLAFPSTQDGIAGLGGLWVLANIRR